MRWHARVNRVGQFDVIFLERLDHCRCMHPGRRAKRILAHHRIVRWNRHASSPRHCLTILLQFGEILPIPRHNAHQLEIDQHLVHLRIAHAFANADGASVNAICPRDQRRHRVGNREPAVAVPVPVQANLLARRLHHFLDHEPHQRERAHGRRVPRSVADHDGPRATTDRCRIQPLHRLRIAARRILGDVHHFQPQRDGIFDGLLRGLKKEVAVPALGVAANGAGSKEGSNLYSAGQGIAAQPDTTSRVRQGFIEKSNVNSVHEMSRMIEITRTYTQISALLQQQHDLHRTAVEKLADVPA